MHDDVLLAYKTITSEVVLITAKKKDTLIPNVYSGNLIISKKF